MEIKKATLKDIDTIQQLAQIIWPHAYSEIISKEQIKYMLNLIYSNTSLTNQMQKGHKFVLAINENIALGFASYSIKSKEEPTTFLLHKIYVLPNISKKGIGSFLLTHVCNAGIKAGAILLELNVNKYNSAKQFYEKKGFTFLKEEVIDIGNGYIMDDFVMNKFL